MAPDAVLCTDGFVTYERIAKDARIPHFALNAGRRTERTPRSDHINTVNALISRFRAFMQPFCGPASKNLVAYGRWHAARNNADRSYTDALKLLRCAQALAPTRFADTAHIHVWKHGNPKHSQAASLGAAPQA